MPMGDAFVRSMNVHLTRLFPPRKSPFKGVRNALISELAYRIYCAHLQRLSPLDRFEVEALALEVDGYIGRLERNVELEPMSLAERNEAYALSENLSRAVNYSMPGLQVTARPHFFGCGILDDCFGDLLVGSTLVEIKNVERDFRLADVRQLLCYCALNSVSSQYSIREIALLNAKSGLFYRTDLDSLATSSAGVTGSALLADIVRYITTDLPSK